MNIGDRLPHSLKPYLLDGFLGWCAANRLTPVLIVVPDENRVVPDHVKDSVGDLAFNVSSKAVVEKTITTEGIEFVTYFKNKSNPERVFLPISCWKGVRIKETMQQMDLSFPETLEHQFIRWPEGISLAPPQQTVPMAPQPKDVSSSGRKASQLSLVWTRPGVECGKSHQA